MGKITDIEGIGPAYAEKLATVGITTVQEMLDKGAQKKDRATLAEATGISEKLILRWTNCADLFRIKGIGSQYADLLEAAGVDTVMELAQRNAANLTAKMVEVNEAKNLVRQTPSEKTVSGWVDQAKELPRAIHY